MPVNTHWYDDAKTIIYFKFLSLWSLEEFVAANQAGIESIRDFDHQVDAIFDFLDANSFPNNTLPEMVWAAKQSHDAPNEGLTVAVVNNRFIETFARVVIAATSTETVQIARTVPQALDLIYAQQQKRRLYIDSEDGISSG